MTRELFVGRVRESELLRTCADKVRSGDSWLAVVEGEAGIGKSALVRGLVGALDDYTVPRDWYVGLIARGRGRTEEAQRAFAAAKEAVLVEAQGSPDDAKVLIMRGLIEAMLGQVAEAIANGERAAERLPISADALDGPLIATNLAAIYALVGRKDQALALLERLVRQIGGPTPGMLRVEPQWDGLRGERKFQQLLN